MTFDQWLRANISSVITRKEAKAMEELFYMAHPDEERTAFVKVLDLMK